MCIKSYCNMNEIRKKEKKKKKNREKYFEDSYIKDVN